MQRLISLLKGWKRVLIALSGGKDSTFLLKTAKDALGEDRVYAITAISPIFTRDEIENAKAIAKELNIRHILVETHQLDSPLFISNTPKRCYYCKRQILERIKEIANDLGISKILDGTNMDDISDYRPGLKALEEFDVYSPLKEVGLTEKEIRSLSKEMGLNTWDRPSMACLATRISYGEPITVDKLKMIAEAEEYLMEMGFRQVRVRMHGKVARIELEMGDIKRFIDNHCHNRTVIKFKELGFDRITLDLEGYRRPYEKKRQDNLKRCP